jgi:hypothetical protein
MVITPATNAIMPPIVCNLPIAGANKVINPPIMRGQVASVILN